MLIVTEESVVEAVVQELEDAILGLGLSEPSQSLLESARRSIAGGVLQRLQSHYPSTRTATPPLA
jgi:hypothetical protein